MPGWPCSVMAQGVKLVDIELLKTFLEVGRTRHFGQAAENLFLTQSAVSARIRLLEQMIGTPVFTRTRNNIQLTSTGQRLLRHAESIVNAWNRARHEVAVEEDARSPLAIGGLPSLWDILLQDWIHALHRNLPELALSVEVHDVEGLLRRLRDGTLDLTFMFESPQITELTVEAIVNVHLVMVSSRPGLSSSEAVRDHYVLVDWGTSFAMAHAKHFPEMSSPVIRMGLGRLAHGYLLDCGGSAYLAESMVSRDISEGRLFLVEQAPVIHRAAYAVYPTQSDQSEITDRALSYLRKKAQDI